MSQSRTLCIGMAVHTDSSAVAYVAQAHGAEVTDLGSIGTRQGDMDQLVRKMPSKATPLIFVYAAGPCGDWLYRYLMKKGSDCWVVAPSLLPQKSGDRVQTDRRDAMPLARLARSGDLTVVYVPQVEDAAIRDLTRARGDARSDCKDAKLHLNAFVRRHASRYTGRATWSPAHLRWLSEVVCPTPVQPSVLQAYVRAVNAHRDRRQRLEHALHEQVPAWRLSPVIAALQALRGVPCTVALPLVAEMGDLTRFASPRERMQCMGLMPSAHSSGEQRRQGSITKAGNTQARRVLVAGAWADRYPAKGSRHLQLRLEKPPKLIQNVSWRAQVRRCKRYRRLVARGKHANGVTVAMARELTAACGPWPRRCPAPWKTQTTLEGTHH